jgi:chaperonin GroES|tara:strand:- start:435 stop:773 length:339 start_codon:yes stop_codon:yes gene_type:complete
MAQVRSDYIEVDSVPRTIKNNIMVKRGKVESKETSGGIIIPDSSRRLDNSGEVVGLGDYGRLTKTGIEVPFEVKIGDIVYFEWHAAQRKLKVGDDFYVILTEQDILFVEEEE